MISNAQQAVVITQMTHMSPPGSSRTNLSIFAILLVGLLIRIYAFGGLAGTDDVFIAEGALRFLDHGWFLPENHHLTRIGLWLPLVPVIKLFGAGEWQVAWLPLALSLLTIWTAAEIGRRVFDDSVGVLAALMAAVFPLDVENATTLFPDVAVGALCGLTVLLALKTSEAKRPTLFAVLSGLAWGWAYLAKIEAAVLLPAIIALWAARYITFRNLVLIGVVVGTVVAAENVIYYLASGHILYRLWVITAYKGNGTILASAYSATQWWIFPRSWFLVFYEFGLQYYLLFGSIIYSLLRPTRGAIVLVVWAVVFMLWLQFGGNPLAASYHIRTHLPRYCSMLSVPAAILEAVFLWRVIRGLSRKLAVIATAGVVLVSLFMINFNRLSFEGQVAIKAAMSQAARHGWFPIYLDSTSRAIASIDWWHRPDHPYDDVEKIPNLSVDKLSQMRSYALVNPSSMRYRHLRYGSGIGVLKWLDSCGKRVVTINNPLPAIVYAQARMLDRAAAFIPLLARKVTATTRELLEGDDAVIYEFGGLQTAACAAHLKKG